MRVITSILRVQKQHRVTLHRNPCRRPSGVHVTYLERNCKFPDNLCACRPEHGDRVKWSRGSVEFVSSSELHDGVVGEQGVRRRRFWRLLCLCRSSEPQFLTGRPLFPHSIDILEHHRGRGVASSFQVIENDLLLIAQTCGCFPPFPLTTYFAIRPLTTVSSDTYRVKHQV